jgi:hypothetical protein
MNTESNDPLNAYQPPPESLENDAPPVTQKTGRIKAICIIAIVMGCLGLLSVLGGTAGLLFGKQIQSAVSPTNQPGVSQEMVRVQKDMEKALQSVQDRFFAVNVALIVMLAFVAFALLIGGVQSLRRVPPARKILVTACSAALVYELVKIARDVAIQAQTIPMTLQHTERMISAGNGPPGAVDFAMTAARVGIVVGILFGAAWVLAKLVFYSISVWYLRKPAVSAYLDGHDVAPATNNGFLS